MRKQALGIVTSGMHVSSHLLTTGFSSNRKKEGRRGEREKDYCQRPRALFSFFVYEVLDLLGDMDIKVANYADG